MPLRLTIIPIIISLLFTSCHKSYPENEILYGVRKMILSDEKFDKKLDNVMPRIDSIVPINASAYYEEEILSNKNYINRWRNMEYSDTLSNEIKEISKLLLDSDLKKQNSLIREYKKIDERTIYYNCYISYLNSNTPVYRVSAILDEHYEPLNFTISYMSDD